jgi:hypothetical protein
MQLAQAAHWVALLLLVVVLAQLGVTGGRSVLSYTPASDVTVSPGDTTVERGSSLVVWARFRGALPPTVELVVGPAAGAKRSSLVKSLADPMFGGSLAEVGSNLVYHIEYGGQRTRDFQVTVFEYPRLERADADVTFPEYIDEKPKHIANTRRLSAVEGSHLDLSLKFNKPVATARLIANDKDRRVIPLDLAQKGSATAALRNFPLETTATYDLQLVDAEHRTNKTPVQFTFVALSNRVPELRLALPRGDQRPSPLEEIAFEGTVWDDFGVKAYGLGYAMAGEGPKFIELGRGVPGKEKRSFQYLLKLEELGVEPDQLLSWFVWADDLGPDGELRRTAGDLFFAEVRPFEEIFREGQAMDGQGGQQQGQGQGQQGSPTTKLADLQKQIISATWKLQIQNGGSLKQGKSGTKPERKTSAPRLPETSRVVEPNGLFGLDVSGEGASRNGERWGGLSSTRRAQPDPADRGQSAAPMPQFFGQTAPSSTDAPATAPPRSRPLRLPSDNPKSSGKPPSYQEDAVVVHDSQAQALDQA